MDTYKRIFCCYNYKPTIPDKPVLLVFMRVSSKNNP